MISIALCDDSTEDLEYLHELLNKYLSSHQIQADVHVFNHPDKLLSQTETRHFHLYLLDIVMPMVNGIQTAREIRWNDKDSQIVFVTSEKSFALESFDVNPINYILKPANQEKIFNTLDLAFSRIKTEENERITIKTKEGLKSFSTDEVIYIEYSNHIVRYILTNKNTIQTVTQRISFDDYISQNIKSSFFVRCHESFLVNLNFLDALSKTSAELRGDISIPVSKSRYSEFQKAYMNFRLK